ncbi:MAG TPA: zinc-binding dehydrogenase [Puia sp.]|nr:zinc-binding dehydrogenase [Puia sp.]
MSTVGIKDEAALKAKGIRGAQYMAHPSADNLQALAQIVDAGKIRPIVSSIFPLKEIEEAEEFLINFPAFF